MEPHGSILPMPELASFSLPPPPSQPQQQKVKKSSSSSKDPQNSSSSSSSSSSPVVKKITHLTVACNACREKKRRCDGQNPCSHCKKREESCGYPQNKKRGPPRGYWQARGVFPSKKANSSAGNLAAQSQIHSASASSVVKMEDGEDSQYLNGNGEEGEDSEDSGSTTSAPPTPLIKHETMSLQGSPVPSPMPSPALLHSMIPQFNQMFTSSSPSVSALPTPKTKQSRSRQKAPEDGLRQILQQQQILQMQQRQHHQQPFYGYSTPPTEQPQQKISRKRSQDHLQSPPSPPSQSPLPQQESPPSATSSSSSIPSESAGGTSASTPMPEPTNEYPWVLLPHATQVKYRRYYGLFFTFFDSLFALVDTKEWLEFATTVFAEERLRSSSTANTSSSSPSSAAAAAAAGTNSSSSPALVLLSSCSIRLDWKGKPLKPSDEALVWAVLCVGSQLAGEVQESESLATKTREALISGTSAPDNNLLRSLFILVFYYFSMRDFRLSLLLLKATLDYFNSLPAVDSNVCLIRDLFCFFLHLPPSTASLPLSISLQEVEEAEKLLDVSLTFDHLVRLKHAEACRTISLRMMTESAGLLMYNERMKNQALSPEVFSMIVRKADLALKLLHAWQWAGPMTTSIEVLCHSTLAWAVFQLYQALHGPAGSANPHHPKKQETEQHAHFRRIIVETLKSRKSEHGEVFSPNPASQDRINREDHYKMQLFAPLLPRSSQNKPSSSNFSSFTTLEPLSNHPIQQAAVAPHTPSHPPSRLLFLSSSELKAIATNHILKAMTLSKDSPWRSYFNPIIIVLLFNLISIVFEWGMWDVFQQLTELMRDFPKTWPFMESPLRRLDLIVEAFKTAKRVGFVLDNSIFQDIFSMNLSALFYLKGRPDEEESESVELPESPFRGMDSQSHIASSPNNSSAQHHPLHHSVHHLHPHQAHPHHPPSHHPSHHPFHHHQSHHAHHYHPILEGGSPPPLSPFLAQELNFGEFDVKEFLAGLETAFGNETDFLNIGDWQ